MAERKLSESDKEFIRGSHPRTHPTSALAEKYSVSEQRIRELRREGRAARHEVAREIIAEHVEVNVPDALGDLTDLRRIARTAYEVSGDSRDGQLWLSAIKTTLEHVSPDDAELDAEIERSMEKLQPQGQAAVAGAVAATNGHGRN